MEQTVIAPTITGMIETPPIYSKKLARNDFVRLSATGFLAELGEISETEISEFKDSWRRLEVDEHMADGGSYRLRRHGTYSASRAGGLVQREAHQPHYQTTKFNTLNGGIRRDFAPIEAGISDNPVMQNILNFASRTFGAQSPLNDWHIEVHQFRINAIADGGKPTPEGVHRDGVDYVLMILVSRSNVIDGETRVIDIEDREVAKFTLVEPFEAVMVNDTRVAHGVTPILPAKAGEDGHRDMLIVTFKRV